MKKLLKGNALTVAAIILVFLLTAALIASWVITENYVVHKWRLYPRNQASLDLRNETLSAADYDTIAWELIETDIAWRVPFQGVRIANDATELTVDHLTAEDMALIEYFPQLQVIHAQNCTDYALLLEIHQRHPDMVVEYTVPIAGQLLPSDTESVTFASITEEDAALLNYLPNLKTVDAVSCKNFPLLHSLADAHPEWNVRMLDRIAGWKIDRSAASVELTGAQYEELSIGLADLPNLQSLMIHQPKASGDELAALQQEYPNVNITWDVEFRGKTYPGDSVELDISEAPIGSVEEARSFAANFPQLTRLVVDSGSVSNDDMAAFRDEVRSRYKVVWSIWLTQKYRVQTDTTYVMPTKVHEYFFMEENVHDLMYLEDVIAVDLGHHPIHTVTWLRYMPHVKYLVLTDTQVKDLSGLESCKELVFLEIDWSYIHDLEPVLGCTALEDLSICSATCDLTVVSQMTWLKHLRWRSYSPYRLIELDQMLPDTIVSGDGFQPSIFTWRNLPNYYASRDALGMPYM